MICLVVAKSTKREIGKTISRLQFTLPEIEFYAMGEKPIAPKRQSSAIGFLALFLSLEQEIIADRRCNPVIGDTFGAILHIYFWLRSLIVKRLEIK